MSGIFLYPLLGGLPSFHSSHHSSCMLLQGSVGSRLVVFKANLTQLWLGLLLEFVLILDFMQLCMYAIEDLVIPGKHG